MGKESKASKGNGQEENQDQEAQGHSFAVLEQSLYDIECLIQQKVEERLSRALLEYGREIGNEVRSLEQQRDYWHMIALGA